MFDINDNLYIDNYVQGRYYENSICQESSEIIYLIIIYIDE
jgi:hypothetical protein